MGEVIEFKKKTVDKPKLVWSNPLFNDKVTSEPDPDLKIIRDILCEDDYLEFLEGVLDPYKYHEVDEDIQDIVDGYMAI